MHEYMQNNELLAVRGDNKSRILIHFQDELFDPKAYLTHKLKIV